MRIFLVNLIIAIPFAILSLFFNEYKVREKGEWVKKGRYKLPLYCWIGALILLLIPVLNSVSYVTFCILLITGYFDGYDVKYNLRWDISGFLKKRY